MNPLRKLYRQVRIETYKIATLFPETKKRVERHHKLPVQES